MSDELPRTDRERLRDLLAEEAVFGLAPEDASEVERLSRRLGDTDPEEFERLAAALAAGLTPADEAPLPRHLRERCARLGRELLAAGAVAPEAPAPARSRRRPALPAWLGWAAAAACLLVALSLWWRRPSPAGPADPARSRADLLGVPDALTARLEGVGAHSEARGDLVWSNRQQRGFMRLTGVPMNDPRRRQYQLWIFDKAQDERYPIDGGVFDITGTGELIVPIRAPIKVVEPYMFAVTAERPGGVVVSKRDPIVLLGKVAMATN